MSSVQSKNVLTLLRQLGSYDCPHFQLQRKIGEKKGCCGSSHQFSYYPTCTLIGAACPGIEACPRLNEQSRVALQESWKKDLLQKKIIKLSSLIKDIKGD